MTFTQTLDQMRQEFIANTPADVYNELFRLINGQQQAGNAFGLSEGQKAKDFTLNNSLGQAVNLYDELSQGPVVLTFYRGGWCPFCNMQLRSYQKVLPQIEAIGGRLIAVSPQSPDNTLTQQEKEDLQFQVLSDTNGLTAAAYNILYDVPDYIQDIFLNKFNLDLAEYNATNRWILPVTSTFMIDESGIVRSAYVEPDFMKRPDPEDILEQLRRL
ncbi:putative peroxiredoxin bcp [compost metagenome]|uniref:thioredoxin-dependent peroxiredoxin n=1 Tax=Paenibacillus rhizolycopersici TaxID=2780073 RepID=A0ABS2HBH8_9BACL|nr:MULTISPECIES: peroxiredoxin-like family protein [Paenibacillus]MBM6998176.1 AhpC/TSA family protein [Paenibacillus rhizolycopersici]MUG84931.1 redoxin domain-containing protein [Paenibacillus timonensis]GIP47799.1 alkyl hydroperoxide reductase [Paenibacillus sp. J53TS2]